MKILFIIPPYSTGVYSRKEREVNWDYHSLGLAYIASVARSLGNEVKVLDCEVHQYSLENIQYFIKTYGPDLIGMQVFYFTSETCYRISSLAKKINPSIQVVMGGLHPTLFPDETISQDGVDFVIREEGEIVFKNLLISLSRDKNFSAIKGIIWKKGKEIVKNDPEVQIEDLDNIAFPALDLFPIELYHSSAMMLGKKTMHLVPARGCPCSCSFCIVPCCFGNTYRSMSAEAIMLELLHWKKEYNIDSFQFLDDCFTFERDRVVRLCSMLKREGLTYPWTCFARVDQVDEDMLCMMKDAGCYQIIYGVETAVPRLLKLLGKNISLDHIISAFDATNRAGIESMASLMIGIPTETVEDSYSTIQFMTKTKADLIIYHRFNPWKGVPLYELAMETGSLVCQDREKYLLKWTPVVYTPKGRTVQEIIDTEKACLRKSYFRPSNLVRTMNMLRKLPLSKSIKLLKSSWDTFF